MVASGEAHFYSSALMLALARFLIHLYQKLLSPILHGFAGPGGGCRFHPTCSEYLLQAIERHGLIRGVGLGLGRITRCHPWGGSGLDPVPPAVRQALVRATTSGK